MKSSTLVILLVVAGAAAGGYYLYQKKKAEAPQAKTGFLGQVSDLFHEANELFS